MPNPNAYADHGKGVKYKLKALGHNVDNETIENDDDIRALACKLHPSVSLEMLRSAYRG